MARKIVIFEEVLKKHSWLINFYLLAGYEVFYSRIHPSVAKSPKLKKINADFRLHYLDGFSDTQSFENMERFYPEFIRKNPFLNTIRDLLADDRAELIFKNILNKKLSRFYYLSETFARIEKLFPEGSVEFVPQQSVNLYQMVSSDISDYHLFQEKDSKVRFPAWCIVLSKWNGFVRRVKLFLRLLGLPFYLVLKKSWGSAQTKQNYRYGVAVLSIRQFENETQSVDFLVDGELIKKEQTVFVPYAQLNQEQIEFFKRKKLNYVAQTESEFSWGYIKKAGVTSWEFLKYCFGCDFNSLDIASRVLFYYVKWNSFADKVHLDNFITQVSDNPYQSFVRDLALAKNGTIIWKYLDSASMVNYYLSGNEFYRTRECEVVYMFCHRLVAWSQDNMTVLASTHSYIERSDYVGYLWSEHIRLVQEGKINSDLKSALTAKGLASWMKVVGVFDSTYNDYSVNTSEDGVKFAQDILHLVEDMNNIFVVFKEKKKRSAIAPSLRAIYEKLEKHPRIYFENHKRSVLEVIAASDLVISYPFTSTGLGALSVKKPAFWHDPSGKFHRTYYDLVPHLVTHNYQDAFNRARNLLNPETAKDYPGYLEKQVKDHCSPYWDGLSITRFRKLLAGREDVKINDQVLVGQSRE